MKTTASKRSNSHDPKNPASSGCMAASHVFQIQRAVAPEVNRAGDKCQHDSQPKRDAGEPVDPRSTSDWPAEDFAERSPLHIAVFYQSCDDGDDLRDRLVFTVAFGGEHEVL